MRQIPTNRQTVAIQVKTAPTQAAMQTKTAAGIRAKTAVKTQAETAARILPTAIETAIYEWVVSERPVRCGLVSFV